MARILSPLSVATAALLLGGCTDTVFRDREPFNPPPDAVSGFLGYFTASTQQTTCGNCHVGHQADWKTTRHANAFATLAALPANVAQASCYSCHTVTEKGNKVTGTAGYDQVQHEAYRDVQCESCHGPGIEHVTLPDNNATVPLANAFLDDAEASCASCHTGIHTPFAEEWAASGHSQVIASPAGRAECASCHEGKATLAAWGANVNYSEKSSATTRPTACAVCHNPHGSENTAQLRFAIDTPDPERNLCMKCHIRRTEPVGGSSYGARPHAPQGAVLLGSAGYRPAGFDYDTSLVFTSHASERNPRLCAGCHVNRFTVTDPASGDFVFQSTGHLFNAIPCLDASGKPTADNTCAYTATARSWAACTNSGCHANAGAASSALTNARGRIKALADVIWTDTDGDETIDAAPTDQGYLAVLKQTNPGVFNADPVVSAAEGAEFNARMVGEGLYANGDKSLSVHNPFLAEALLRANINELQDVYGLTAPPAAVQRIMEEGAVRLRQAGVTAARARVSGTTKAPVWLHSGTSGGPGGRE
jgi:predicted CXXCH cytochrome family protein